MQTRTLWLTLAMATCLLAAPGAASGQDVGQPDPIFPFPLWHSHAEQGGLYAFGEFVMLRQNNPLSNQPIAVRGFQDMDGSLTGHPGQFVGNFTIALKANDVGGPLSFEPGFRTGIGWRFEDEGTFEVSWLHIMETRYTHVVTDLNQPFAQNIANGLGFANTFLFSPVFNFPDEYGGTAQKLAVGNPGATFGIWNAANQMIELYIQRFEQIDANWRENIFETECTRCYGIVGGRFAWFWDKFWWSTQDRAFNGGFVDPTDVADYTNITSNRMYGAHIGLGTECYFGHGFAGSVEVDAAALLDVVKERASWELGIRSAEAVAPINKRSITTYTPAAELSMNAQLWWYPIEGVQIRLGYDVMSFFNTIASTHPVDFNWGALTPAYNHVTRFLDGFNVGIALIF
jgi:hypothetical protein